MKVPVFDPKELKVVSEMPPSALFPAIKIFDYPVTSKEAYRAMLQRKPIWQVTLLDSMLFTPALYPDNIARGQVFEGHPFNPVTEGGGPDMFGIEWEYVEQVGGSMVRPGEPFIEDANELAEKIVWPDIEKWPWEEAAARNNETFLASNAYMNAWFVTGWYERLISLMDFEGAVMAVFDEDQQDAVKAFFDKLTDLYIKMLEKFFHYMPKIDGVCFHDDWGSQKETFFSPAVAEEMIVPYMKRLTDYVHSTGRQCELHSCGQLLKQVPNIIAAGWDYWNPQLMNDTHKIYELYGDKLMVGVAPEPFDLENTTEEEQRKRAREYADKFCDPKKPSVLNQYSCSLLTPAFREELYIRSRENYSKG
ncbi:MAG: methyltransferase [Oscillospiraceae bacterium]|nr:methyltransferase [Oscillospiraceae bacterium]